MKIVIYSSHTSTWSFAFAEAVIAFALQKRRHKVLFVTPGNLFKNKSNLKQETILRKEFGLSGYKLENVLTEADYKEINLMLKKIDKNNFSKLTIDNIQVGKIAMYEFLLENKKTSSKILDSEWGKCLSFIKETLFSLFACRRIIEKEKPQVVLVYNSLYSVNHVWEKYAKFKNIPFYFLHNGLNYSDSDKTLIVAKRNSLHYFGELKAIWSKVKKFTISKEESEYVTNHFLSLLKAKHPLIYSTPKSSRPINIRETFNIKNNQKILTATMSSYDEMFAAEYVGVRKISKKIMFATQVDWIKALINYVKNKKNLFLIIRVHPREFPNKRESVKSDHAKMLEKVLNNLPDNVKINWPTDKISIYDLAQETDVFLNAWSSVGVEMSLLGIPVVIYSKDLILYPHDLNYLARNRRDYFAKIEQALIDGWSYEKIKKTYKWLALYYYHTIVRLRHIEKGMKQSNISKLLSSVVSYFYGLIPTKLRTFLIKIYFAIPGLGIGQKQVNDCRRQLSEHINISQVEKMLKNSGDTLVDVEKILKSKVTKKEEDRFIRREIKRIYPALYGDLLEGTSIKKGGLQCNLMQVFKNKNT